MFVRAPELEISEDAKELPGMAGKLAEDRNQAYEGELAEPFQAG